LKNKNIRIGKREIVCSNLVLWSIAFLLFAAMVPYMFWLNALSDKIGLSGGIFSEAGYALLGGLDWLTVMTIGVAIVMPFFTKKEARDLGWDSQDGNLDDVAPGMSIGGDTFGNREGILPKEKGRKYYECDVNYEGGYRGGERIVYSNDGLIFYTEDHYKSFEQLY
jgi:hypothetical protein